MKSFSLLVCLTWSIYGVAPGQVSVLSDPMSVTVDAGGPSATVNFVLSEPFASLSIVPVIVGSPPNGFANVCDANLAWPDETLTGTGSIAAQSTMGTVTITAESGVRAGVYQGLVTVSGFTASNPDTLSSDVAAICVEVIAGDGTFPGTAEDFRMLSSVGAAPPDAADIETAGAGDLFNLRCESPDESFVGKPLFIIADLFITGSPPIPLTPGISVGTSFVVVIGYLGPLGPPALPAAGFNVSFNVPPILSGIGRSLMFQGVILSVEASNGLYASTNAHIVQIL